MTPLTPLSAIIFLGALHGFVLAAILWTTSRGLRTANRVMAILLAVTSLNMLDALFLYHRLYTRLPHLLFLVDPSVLLLGPLCLMYCRIVSGRSARWSPRLLVHALPALAVWLSLLPFILRPGPDKAALVEGFLAHPPPSFALINALRYVQVLAYLIASFRVIHRRVGENRREGGARPSIGAWWPLFLVGFGIVIWFTSMVLFQTRPDRINESIVQLLAAALLFAIGYLGILHPETLYFLRPPAEPRKYERSVLRKDQTDDICRRLLALMEHERPYREPDLGLPQLAGAIDVPPHHLSQVLNERFGQNFYRFVNGYRVEEAKRRLTAPDTAREKLITIAFAAGFNSLATFNRVFKETTGKSPSAFRRQPS